LTEQEYQIIADAFEAERSEAKAEIRKARLKEALAEEAKEKQKEETKSEIKAKFKDGITWESADKSTSISVNGRLQLDYRNFGGADAIDADTFDIRRAYLGAKGKFYDNYSFLVQADFSSATGGLALDEAWVNIAWWKPAQFKIGQFKMPMTLEDLTSDLFTDFQERSLINAQLPGKERGAQVWGEPKAGINYALAVSTGQGKNVNDVNNSVDGNDVIGRVAVNFAQLMDNKDAVFHLGGSFSDGTIPVTTLSSGRTEARGIAFFNTAAFTGTDVDRTRGGLEGAVAWGPVKLQSEYFNVNFEGTSAAGVNYDRDIEIYYANVSWLITGEKYADSYSGGVFGRLRPKANFKPGSDGLGAWELGLRYTNFDASDFATTNAVGTGVLAGSGTTTTSTNKADSLTLGLKWTLNPNTQLSVNYIDTSFDTPVVVTPGAPGGATTTSDEKALNFRAQFDF
jgi:phosphate-selective porin OprO and OprP